MLRVRSADRLVGGVAVAAAATAVLALLAGGGCELMVGDAIPSFTCLPGAADNCPTDWVCVPSTRQCVARSETCTPGVGAGCAAGMRCDAQTLRCATVEVTVQDASDDADATSLPAADSSPDASGLAMVDSPPSGDAPVGDASDSGVGSNPDAPSGCHGITCSCSRNADCTSGICAGELTETTPLSMSIGSFCTQSCCSSADCPRTTVCFGTGGGGNYCVAPSWIGRNGDLGTGVGGAACQGEGDCFSGLCVNSMCADTCCSTAQESSACASGTVCRFAAFPGAGFDTHETAWCGAAIGTTAGGSPCVGDGTCQSGKCDITRCEAVCRSSADCTGGMECSYGLAPTTLPSNSDIVAGCVTSTGTAANGTTCSSNADCQSAFCDGFGHCTDVCVTDADCKAGMHCVPDAVKVQGNYSVLCCES